MKIKRFLSLLFCFIIVWTSFSVCSATDDAISQAMYNEDTQSVSLYIDGLDAYIGKEASLAMFDSKNPIIPVYFAQPKVNEYGALDYTFVFRMPKGRFCDEYTITVNVANQKMLTLTPKSIYDRKCQVYIENLQYSVGEGEKAPLNEETISQLYKRNVNISFDITGKGAASLDTVILAAVKVQDVLDSLTPVYNGSIDFDQTIPLNFDVSFPENGKLEIYILDSMNNLKPLRDNLFSVEQSKEIGLSLAVSDEPIYTNPGKGYLRYAVSGTQSEEVLTYASAGYARFHWAEIEPSEGVYNWKPIDDAITYWKSQGKGFAFGVINANTASATAYVTPKWVFDAGAQFTQTTLSGGTVQYTPVWNDTIFLQKVTNFVNALAKRYDGNQSVEFIDVRSYGNYGEMHVGNLNSTALSFDDRKVHIDIYADAFEKTSLLMNVNKSADAGLIAKYAVSRGVGLRNDGIGSNVAMAGLTLDAKYNAPVALEFATGYATLKSNAENISSDNADRAWKERSYLQGFELSAANYMDLGQYGSDSDLFIADQETVIQDIADRMGYKFALRDMKVSTDVKSGASCKVITTWENFGVGYLYRDCYIALAVLDENGDEVNRIWLENTNANSFAPNSVTECSDTFKMWNLGNGEYTLAIGLFLDKSNESPDYQIANVNRLENGWYPVANLVSQKGINGVLPLDGVSEEIDEIPSYEAAEQYIPDGELIGDYQITPETFIWTGKNGADVTVSTSNPYSGSYSGRIYNRKGALYGAQIDITERLAANGPGTYKMTGKFRGRNGVGLGIYLGYMNAGATTKTIAFDYAGNSWTEISKEFTVSASDINSMAQASLMIVGRDGVLYSGDTTKDIYFDDVKITKIN